MAGWVPTVLADNITANACLKLAAINLHRLLDLDADTYGADAEQRPDLIAVARERIRHDRGMRGDVRTFLVGDTARDVEAAFMTGSEIITGSTGVHSQSDVVAASALVVITDLTQTRCPQIADLISAR